ncbi:MAG TPA: hypothetical protein VEQ11_19555 [Chloroflexota bacterium]|nr:hypothetical protein [Chloroflexota bacterium]
MLGRIVKRIAHRAIRGLIAHPVRGLIMLIVLLAAAGVLAFQGFQQGAPSFSIGVPSLPRSISGAPTATENYMRGNESYNAELMWSGLSDEALARYRSRGGSLQALQGQMDQAKQAGSQLDQITYIGGQSFPDGTSMHFYVVLARGPQSRGETEYVPYVFTLDRAGKISRVQ